MTAPRVPNDQLRMMLAESGWTGSQLARAVNAVGGEVGLEVSYDRTAVSHWLAGRCPRPPVAGLIAEALSRTLGRKVTVADIGLGDPGTQDTERRGTRQSPEALAGSEDIWQEDMEAVLTRLADADRTRRKLIAGCAYSVAALAVPVRPRAAPVTTAADTARLLTAGQAEAAEAMAVLFRQADETFGGGHARGALAKYLAHDLGPQLHATASPGLRRRLFTAGTQLTYLCGFMHFDEELHGMAQRYYTTALRLAAANGDHVSYAITLRAMSVQAHVLGHHWHAVQLAEAAVAAGRGADAGRQAFLHGQLAVAHAAVGDRASALASLAAAGRRLDRASSPGTGKAIIGAYHPASLAHQEATILALHGDRKRAIAALSESIQHRPASERRAHAITLAQLAELQLAAGCLEAAVATWQRFLDDYPSLHSGRAASALKALRTRVRPHGTNPAARNLLTRAALLQHQLTG